MASVVTPVRATHEKLLRARQATGKLAQLSSEAKNALLFAMADAVEANRDGILAANHEDVESSGLAGAMRDRLLRTPARIQEIANGEREVAALTDPVVETVAGGTRPHGLRRRKDRGPI